MGSPSGAIESQLPSASNHMVSDEDSTQFNIIGRVNHSPFLLPWMVGVDILVELTMTTKGSLLHTAATTTSPTSILNICTTVVTHSNQSSYFFPSIKLLQPA